MRNVLHELGYSTAHTPSPLCMDNQSAVSVTKNPEHHGRMKQLDLCFYWLRERVEDNSISTSHIPGAQQIADILTKPLPLPKSQFCRQKMGISR